MWSLRTELPADVARAARQIAALANSAYGETVLWIAGIDEKNRQIPGAKATELSDWWAKVESYFDEVSPSIQSLTVRFQEVDLLSLAFGTDRVPFVVKNPDGGRITREVPWRGANRTDSARRSELIRLLNPSVKMPSFEILDVTFLSILQNNIAYRATVSVTIYVLPQTTDRVVFPIHKLYLAFEQSGKMPFRFGDVQVKVPHGQNFDYNRQGRLCRPRS